MLDALRDNAAGLQVLVIDGVGQRGRDRGQHVGDGNGGGVFVDCLKSLICLLHVACLFHWLVTFALCLIFKVYDDHMFFVR